MNFGTINCIPAKEHSIVTNDILQTKHPKVIRFGVFKNINKKLCLFFIPFTILHNLVFVYIKRFCYTDVLFFCCREEI